jgi:hypothetical protein
VTIADGRAYVASFGDPTHVVHIPRARLTLLVSVATGFLCMA